MTFRGFLLSSVVLASAAMISPVPGELWGAQKALAQGVGGSSIIGGQRNGPLPPGPMADDGPDDFDSLDEAPPRPQADRAPPPQIQSQPVQSQPAPMRGPQGPILSPDDPRYSRAGQPGGFIYPDSPARGPDRQFANPAPQPQGQPQPQQGQPAGDGVARPPAGVTAGVPDGQPSPTTGKSVAILPEEDQPETGAPKELPPHLKKQEVDFPTTEPVGTIVVDTANTHLYYVLGNGRAVRYGIRVGRDGFRWAGTQKVTKKTEWPDWHPPPEMIERQPYLPRFMAGGDGNPLGSRALYLGNTVYRIHGTNQPSTIGKTVSSGCFGLLNEDVNDLFERVKVGARVVVIEGVRREANVGAPVSLAAPGQNQGNLQGGPQAGAQGGPVPQGQNLSGAQGAANNATNGAGGSFNAVSGNGPATPTSGGGSAIVTTPLPPPSR